jgi:large subunit ribosomal protein L23
MTQENLELYSYLEKPALTSKAYQVLELNKYVFFVKKQATKTLIKEAVEKIFNKSVERVHIINVKGKKKVYKQKLGTRPDRKKAIITLKAGDKIEEIKKD